MALTGDRDTKCRTLLRKRTLKLAASQTIYKGAIVSVNASGLAIPGADTASTKRAGVAEHYAASGASGDVYVTVLMGCFLFANDSVAPVAQAHLVNGPIVIKDDQTVSSNTTNDIPLGEGDEIDTVNGGVWVWID